MVLSAVLMALHKTCARRHSYVGLQFIEEHVAALS